MQFEWHEAKRLGNIAKHGLDFLRVAQLFAGETIQLPVERGGEPRLMVIGVLEGRIVTLICTYRGDACRVISLRRARDGEKKRYQALHGG